MSMALIGVLGLLIIVVTALAIMVVKLRSVSSCQTISAKQFSIMSDEISIYLLRKSD